jgi:rhodanese-related sulfurtransferase
MNKKSLLIIILVSGLFLSACDGRTVGKTVSVVKSGNSYSNITHEELGDMFENKDFLLVNVHIPYQGNIPQTDLSIPYNQIDKEIDNLPNDKDAKIVVYCRNGSMSAVAAEKLVSMGYTNIINLEGGFHGWEDAGFPMEDSVNQ